MEDKLLSLKEIAQYLGISVATARRYVKARTVPALKVGRLWRIKQSALAKYIQDREQEGRK
jgi:excisionase family DNA binding protein